MFQLFRILVPPDKDGNMYVPNLNDAFNQYNQMNPNSTIPKRIKLTRN